MKKRQATAAAKAFQQVRREEDTTRMANQFTKEQIVEFKKMFSKFDQNGDGKITIQELGLIILALSYAHFL